MPANPQSICQKVRDITGWTDAQIGQLVGMSPATVEAYRLGYRTEYVNAEQMQTLCKALEIFRDRVSQSVDAFLLFA